MLIVISATLNALDTATATSNRNQKLVDTVDRARNTMETVAKKLRNATAYQTSASATSSSLLRAESKDIAFKVVNPFTSGCASNTYSVRPSATASTAPRAACGSSARPTPSRPAPPAPTPRGRRAPSSPPMSPTARAPSSPTTPRRWRTSRPSASSSSSTRTPGKAPAETTLNSGVFLRNQNRRPTAAFTAITSAVGSHVQLNGSNSVDPEGELLTYEWKDGATVLTQTSPIVDYVAPTSGSHTFTLTVTDSGGLTSTTTQTVDVP